MIWFFKNDSKQLPKEIMGEIENETNDIFVSTASIWEMAIKSSLGKLELPRGLGEKFRQELEEQDFQVLDVRYEHAIGVMRLPFVHRDPFDRLLISQCKEERLVAITDDHVWQDARYAIKVKWKW